MATEATKGEETANDWPPHTAADVARVIAALEVFAETGLSQSDRYPHATMTILDEACSMLNSYRLSCFVTEKDNDRRTREDAAERVSAHQRQICERNFDERVKVAAELKAKEQLRDLAKIQKNAKRRQVRNGAKKGARRG